jgi:beta-glucosidase
MAVIGPNAHDVRVLHGNYEGQASHPVTVLDGIKAHVPAGTQVLYSPGCDLVQGYRASRDAAPIGSEELTAQAVELARKADVTVFVGGLSPTVEGEEMDESYPGFKRGDRTDLNLPESQHRLLKALQETGKPVVLVLMSGSALAIPWEAEALPAILQAWYPGQQGGNAIADVLFGDTNPAGRLPVTAYRSVDQVGDFNDYRMEGKTYRYFRGEPLYPFGYGLSFTHFEYKDLKLSRSRIGTRDSLGVTFTVTNAGSRDGQEVAQLYVREVASSLPRPVKQLRGFARIALKKGEARQVRMTLQAVRDLSHYDEQGRAFAVEPGQFEIQVGGSCQDIQLRQMIVVR